jgi:ribosomal protein S18 acetylase RimI-like enzyme
VVAHTAARRESAASHSGLRPVNLTRDLGQIAALMELVFGPDMDPQSRSAMREMQLLAHSGPWLWLLASLNQVGEGFSPGFVWVEQGRVIGNVSVRRAGTRGEGWLIGNVAVHPDYRRRGIALALMQAALGLMHARGGRWAGLLVEHDNQAALRLYERMGFYRLGAVTTWQGRPPGTAAARQPALRRLRPDEWEAEYQLARNARPAPLKWMEPLSRSDFRAGWPRGLVNFLRGRREEHWVAAEGERLLAALRIRVSWAGDAHEIAIFVHPQVRGVYEASLLAHGLARLPRGARAVQVEHPAGDTGAESALRDLGLTPVRTLVHMKLDR